MDRKEFSHIRRQLGKTQRQMAQLLGTSQKAMETFEQGWRDISLSTERQALFLMALRSSQKKVKPCWVIKGCAERTRQHCPAWEVSGSSAGRSARARCWETGTRRSTYVAAAQYSWASSRRRRESTSSTVRGPSLRPLDAKGSIAVSRDRRYGESTKEMIPHVLRRRVCSALDGEKLRRCASPSRTESRTSKSNRDECR